MFGTPTDANSAGGSLRKIERNKGLSPPIGKLKLNVKQTSKDNSTRSDSDDNSFGNCTTIFQFPNF